MRPENLNKFVVPVFKEAECGVGCFVGDYFITAGHVVKDNDTYVFFKGKKYFLKLDDAIVWDYKDNSSDEDMRDYAVFLMPGTNSPLRVPSGVFPENRPLDVVTFTHIPGFDPVNGDIKQFICKAAFKRNIFAFCECSVDTILHEGSSGSPLICDDMVLGILSGNLPDSGPGTLLFQLTSFIRLDK